MPVVFEDLEPDVDPGPERRPAPRWLPAVAGVAVIGLVAGLVARNGSDERVRAPSSSPSTSEVVAFVPTAARGAVVTPGSALAVVLDQYALPGVMSVSGRLGWRFDPSGSTADVRRYTALNPATGTLGPTVTFGVADRAPSATIEAETTRYTATVATGGASGPSIVYSAFEGAFAGDLSFTDGHGRYVVERIWLHDGIALFVRVVDVDASAVTALFDESVRYGVITP